MWNEALVKCARANDTGVLTVVEPSGYPISVRCVTYFDDSREVIAFPELPPIAVGWRGKACLQFHRHNERLEDFHELLIKGELVEEDGALVMRPTDFVTGTGSPKTDLMPHAGTPLQLIQFMLLGRRKAREYLAKRGEPWPPVDFKALVRIVGELKAEQADGVPGG